MLRRPLLALCQASGLALCLALPPGPVRGAPPLTLRLCANAALGDPAGNNSSHVLARQAFARLPQLAVQLTPLPWQRCLSEAAAGRFDAVLAASHTPERALGLVYPLDAQGAPDARLRLFKVGYVLLRRKSSAVTWDGERFSGSSPRPGEAIGAERGYAIVLFARDRGAHVEDRYPSHGSLIDSLRLQRIAGVLLNQESAAQLLRDESWARDHELAGPPLQTRAYFLPFSRRFAEAHPALCRAIWEALAAARESPAFKTAFSLGMSGGRRRDIAP